MINIPLLIAVAPAEMAIKAPFVNFGNSNDRVPVFEANEFFCGWNELRMVEHSLILVYPADSFANFGNSNTRASILKQVSSFVVEMSLEWLNTLSYWYIPLICLLILAIVVLEPQFCSKWVLLWLKWVENNWILYHNNKSHWFTG